MTSYSGVTPRLTTRFVVIYTQLFQGAQPEDIAPNDKQFWTSLLSLDVNREHLQHSITTTPAVDCLGRLKPFFNALFINCLNHLKDSSCDETVRSHAVETLCIVVRYVLAKGLAGWEIMDVLAGGVSTSDAVFMDLVTTVDALLQDASCPPTLRHQTLQLALIFMCGMDQLSPGAYFLRKDLFPAISAFVTSPDTERYAFEAVLFLSVLANFHRSEAAKLNPVIARIQKTTDEDFMRKACWAAKFATETAISAYQNLMDEELEPNIVRSLGQFVTSFSTTKPQDAPRQLFKSQPIEGAVILLAVYEFLSWNSSFAAVVLELIPTKGKPDAPSNLPMNLLTFSSYVLTHATSTASPRAIAYADICLRLLLLMTENAEIMNFLCQPGTQHIRLCCQRRPSMPVALASRQPVGALLDCCVLWLRHNLHKRLEVHCYTICIWLCQNAILTLQRSRIRIDYDWKQLWAALLELLGFLVNKLDNTTISGIERLVHDTLDLLDLCLAGSDAFMNSPVSKHELLYELVRSSSILTKQSDLVASLGTKTRDSDPLPSLPRLLKVTAYYEAMISNAGAKTATSALRLLGKEVEKDGIHEIEPMQAIPPIKKRSTDSLTFRYLCSDGLALMP